MRKDRLGLKTLDPIFIIYLLSVAMWRKRPDVGVRLNFLYVETTFYSTYLVDTEDFLVTTI